MWYISLNVIDMRGKLKFFKPVEYYGFLVTPDGDLFFHGSSLVESYRDLMKDDDVEFEVVEQEGRKEAVNVRRVKLPELASPNPPTEGVHAPGGSEPEMMPSATTQPTTADEATKRSIGHISPEIEIIDEDKLPEYLNRITRKGLFPLMGYNLESRASSSIERIECEFTPMTSNIPDLVHAHEILEKHVYRGFNLGHSLEMWKLDQLANGNPHVFMKHPKVIIKGLEKSDVGRIGRLVARNGTPFVREKGFALVDICEFSRKSSREQLACLYSLTNMLDSSIRRCNTFLPELHMEGNSRYGRNSTGDGFYFWHDGLGAGSDTITFMVLVCLMAQYKTFRTKKHFPMKLRASYFLGSAFLFYDEAARLDLRRPASNAIGEATNGAARLLAESRPGQILVNDFNRIGQNNELMNTESLIEHCNQLFRKEGSRPGTLRRDPEKRLRVLDKHLDAWYCFNVLGDVQSEDETIEIGVSPDKSVLFDKNLFNKD